MFNSPFETAGKITKDCQIVFVADAFIDDYQGGAEFTTEALIEASPYKVCKIKTQHVTLDVLKQGVEKYWVFTNFARLDAQLIPTIIGNLKYSIIEYDYKYCKYRSAKKHAVAEGKPCNCQNEETGKLVSAFYYGATNLWWMSEGQMDIYHKLFPFLADKKNTVLSSVFNKRTLAYINELNKNKEKNDNYVVLRSPSWIKGYEAAREFCNVHTLQCDEVWGLRYDELLAKLAAAKGIVYLPQDYDTCPRFVIEAKLLGCELILNEHVQHKDEEWFNTDNIQHIAEYLFAAPNLFWGAIRDAVNYKPTLSGYTTTLNCIEQNYPFEQAIQSLVGFCDEVVVVDGGSTDGTWTRLLAIQALYPNVLKIHKQERDWNSKRFAVFDGLQKALARSLCTKEFCWQMDSDEVLHVNDHAKVRDIMRSMPNQAELFALPVIEYWGSMGKVRMDVNPWKWRLSRNLPHITHGIPADLRRFDGNGELYAEQGSDGCDYIRFDNYSRIVCHTFYTQDAENARCAALAGDEHAKEQYTAWVNNACDHLPAVYHFSWWNIIRKIQTYKRYWSRHWESLFNIKQEDTAENNKFFDMPWSDVTDEMIIARAKELEEGTGGWIFHSKWNGDRIPHMTFAHDYPDCMKTWCANTK